MVKTALIALCAFTLVATGSLTLSLLILQPPGANQQRWLPLAAAIIAQGGLTLIVVAGRTGGDRVRWLVVAGAAAVMWLGAASAYAAVHATHFEGYALVLGSALAVQGVVTLAFLTPDLIRAAHVR
jgi:hypothetical protein